ncbi:tonsoku-like protein [Episyrphus balteatus]|uniref:tonsoku-like protein n=1 Tax=Episyrphus balteatus TaxID=286459 RepID=UPI002484E79D|nr:tonsoku-like protein [Episyrphus balteatus]
MEEKKFIKKKEKAFTDGNQSALATACNNLGDFYNGQGKYKEAVAEYEQEASIYLVLGKQLDLAKAHRMCGEMCMLLCEFTKALEHIEIYLKTVKKLRNKVEEQRAYATLGRAYLLQGQSATDSATALAPLKNAEKAFIRSLLISKELSGQITKLEQLDMQARLFLNIGVVKEHIEEFEESVNYIEKAIKISKANEIFELLHLCYVSMSLLYQYKLNDSTLALRYCNLALEVAKRLPDKVKKICETLIAKAEILVKEGDFSSAKQILTKAYKKNTPDENDRQNIEKTLRVVVKMCQILDELITTNTNNYSERKKLFERLGDGCCHLNNFPKAIEYYTQMLECAQLNSESGKELIPIYVSLYQTYKDNKQYDKALEFLWKEFELSKEIPAEAFSTLCSIGEVCELQMQPFWTIQDIYQRALDFAKKAGNAHLEKIAFTRLKKNQTKFHMHTLAEQLEEDARLRGFDLDSLDEDSDSESAPSEDEPNTPELGDDVCLEDLTDSDSSDIDESEKVRNRKRGTCLTIKRNNKGETQLHQACIAGNLELVRRLIDQGHVINVRDHAGWLPLHEACNHGFRDIVELLLDKGATTAINDKGGTSCDGITPLYDACANGFLDVVELLLERGANATVKTDYGETCMQALDKWKANANLNPGEEAQYGFIRKNLSDKLGISGGSGLSASNSNRRRSGHALNRSMDNPDLCTPALEEVNNHNYQPEVDEERTPTPRSPLRKTSAANSPWKNSANNSPRKNPYSASPRKNLYPISPHKKTYSNSPRKSSSAKDEYRSVMEHLKRPNRMQLSTDDDDQSTLPKKRPAFLENEDVDDDDWLEDDVGQDRKRRKCQNDWELESISRENLSDSAVGLDDNDAFKVLLESGSSRQKQASKLRLPRSLSSVSVASGSSGKKNKQQTSLFDSGFCRFRSESPISSEEISMDVVRPTEPDSTTQPPTISLVSPMKIVPTEPIVLSTVSFKIKVEEELLLVPVDRKKLNEVNIRWLAEEASRRYYNLVGLKPQLRLKTADGFAFEENDPIKVAVEENMITATVIEWKISPLAQRYEEMCHQTQKEVQTDIQSALEKGQVSNSIIFSDFSLTPDLTEPVFKAILHQTNLRVLDLSNNLIQNEGCKQLAKSLPTLKQLKALNLRGNCITSDGLESLTLSNVNLEDLEELNLSQNPLGNKSIRSLDKLLKGCKSLQKLILSHCGITNFFEFDLNFYQLSEFDVSFNSLTSDCLKKLLTLLNSSRLQGLNLSFCVDSDKNCATRIGEFFESGTCEKFKKIELAGCYLTDADIYKFTQSLNKASELEVLNLAENPSLSPLALQYVFDELSSLRKLIVTNCPKMIDVRKLDTYPGSKILPNFISLTLNEPNGDISRLRKFWDERWSGRGKIKNFGTQFVCFVNEQDLL